MSTLRGWEERFGFPSVARLPGGHRRYDERDIERILRVVAERARGRSLAGAIKMVLDDPPPSTQSSIYAAVRQLRPDLPVQVLSRRSMRAISHAIEDESRVHAEPPLLVAAFSGLPPTRSRKGVGGTSNAQRPRRSCSRTSPGAAGPRTAPTKSRWRQRLLCTPNGP